MQSPSKKPLILIVDDVSENIRMLMEILKEGYATMPATSGQDALRKIKRSPKPDLVLLDIRMPDMDGYEVCRILKADEETRDIPVIFITAVSESHDDAKAFSLGAADYIAKPFTPATVKARVNNQIKLREAIKELQLLYQRALDSNPITGLPGNNSIRESIERALSHQENKFVIYADLDNFKAYNDTYGFARGDEVIHFTADLLKESLSLAGDGQNTFLGHVGGDDFVLLVPQGGVESVVNFITAEFDSRIKQFYSAEDAEAGCIRAKNRQGEKCSFPLVSISLAAVNLPWSKYIHYLEVNEACSQVKKKAKQIDGSSFFLDRRQRRIKEDSDNE